MKRTLGLGLLLACGMASAQNLMTPELLWKLGRVSGETLTSDGKAVIYGVSFFNIEGNKSERNLYKVPVAGGVPQQLTTATGGETVLKTDANGVITYLHKGQIWQMDANGANAKQISNLEGGLSNVRISP